MLDNNYVAWTNSYNYIPLVVLCILQSLPRSKQADTVIALYGQYSHVTLLDSNSLEVLCTLRSSHAPNWIASVAFLSNIEKKGDLRELLE